MSGRRPVLAALAVAALILAVGVAYVVTREARYESNATLLLAPAEGTDPGIVSSLLDSYQRSGASGTFVELIASEDTLERARADDVDVDVRAVPDSRAIAVTATGPRDEVQPAVSRVIRTAQSRQGELGDVWQLEVLAQPGEPVRAGVSTPALLAAVVLLALLGGALALVLLGRYRLVPSPAERDPAALASGGPAAAASGAPQLAKPAEPRVHLDLQSFRYLRASPTTVLLQVSGYWRAPARRGLETPTLLLHDGRRMHPLAPLADRDGPEPEAGPATPLWRGSYAAPVDIFDRWERIALRAGPGVVIGLPKPVEQALLGTRQSGEARDGAGRESEAAEHPTAADTR